VRAEAGELLIVVSTMAIAETYKIDGETPDGAKRIIQEFFDRKWIDPVAAGRRVAEVAAEIRRGHGIKGADSIHVATALVTRCPILLTDDGRDKSKKHTLLPLDGLLALDGDPLRIMTPEDYHAMRVAEVNPIFAKPEAAAADDARDQIAEPTTLPDGGMSGDE
jgi:predicted nucleic acid-binding protein